MGRSKDEVPASPMQRFMELGGLVGRLGASVIARSVGSAFVAAQDRANYKLDNYVKQATRMVESLSRMKGGAMKVGQMLSLQEGLLPDEVTRIFATLQNQSTPIPLRELQPTLDSELPGHSRLFVHIDEMPLAAASIGQVHAARLMDGREVVLKIQYPNIETIVSSDLTNLKFLLKAMTAAFSFDVDGAWTEVEQRLKEELDYENERIRQEEFREYFAGDANIRIARTIPEACTARVLTMERIAGKSLREVAASHNQADRDRVGTMLFSFVARSLFQFGRVHADPNAGNFAVAEDGALVVYDFGSTKEIPQELDQAYRKIVRAALEDDRGALPAHIKELGIHFANGDPVKGEMIDDYLDIFGPALWGEYSFASDDGLVEKAMELGRRYFFEALGLVFPPDVVFIDRGVAGTLANLRLLGSCANWGRILRGFALTEATPTAGLDETKTRKPVGQSKLIAKEPTGSPP